MSTTSLDKVRDAYAVGANTRKEIRVLTGLDEGIVDLCVDVLIDQGVIEKSRIKGGCATGGCTSCAEDDTCHPAQQVSGPVFIELGIRKNQN